MGRIGNKGYGTFGPIGAHRISFELANGKVPKGLVLDHICRVRHCVNPDHLRIVTRGQNVLENSVSACAINKAKTHCIHGHDFKTFGFFYKNSLYPNKKNRGCRLCKNLKRRVIPKPKIKPTHCRKGHEYTKENSIFYKNKRDCRRCRKISLKKYRSLKRLEKNGL